MVGGYYNFLLTTMDDMGLPSHIEECNDGRRDFEEDQMKGLSGSQWSEAAGASLTPMEYKSLPSHMKEYERKTKEYKGMRKNTKGIQEEYEMNTKEYKGIRRNTQGIREE